MDASMASGSTASDGSCEAKPAVSRRTSGPTRRSTKAGWTDEEDELLARVVKQLGGKNWKRVAEFFPGRTDVQCLHRWQKVLNPELIKGSWTKEEDNHIVDLVRKLGSKKWSAIARYLPGRIGKQCRERWHNHLNPAIRKDAWTKEEEAALIHAHKVYGNRWAKIAKMLPGRSDNSIKNHWNCSLRKRLDSFCSSGFLDEPHGRAALREEFPKAEPIKQDMKDLRMPDHRLILDRHMMTATGTHEKALPGIQDLSLSCILSGDSGGIEVDSNHYRVDDSKHLKIEAKPLLMEDCKSTVVKTPAAEDLDRPILEAGHCKKPIIHCQDESPFACHCTSSLGEKSKCKWPEAINCVTKSWHGDDSDHTFCSNDSSCTSVLRPLEHASPGIQVYMPFPILGCFDKVPSKAPNVSQDCGADSADLCSNIFSPQLMDTGKLEGTVQPAENQNHCFTPPNLPVIADCNTTSSKSVRKYAAKSTICPIANLKNAAKSFSPLPSIISSRGRGIDTPIIENSSVGSASAISAGKRLEAEFDKVWDFSRAGKLQLNASRIT